MDHPEICGKHKFNKDFGLEKGSDFGKWAAHPHLIFLGASTPQGISTTLY